MCMVNLVEPLTLLYPAVLIVFGRDESGNSQAYRLRAALEEWPDFVEKAHGSCVETLVRLSYKMVTSSRLQFTRQICEKETRYLGYELRFEQRK